MKKKDERETQSSRFHPFLFYLFSSIMRVLFTKHRASDKNKPK